MLLPAACEPCTWDGRDDVVEHEDRAVVVLTRIRDFALDTLQLLLQELEVLARLQVRIVLRDREQGAKGAGERVRRLHSLLPAATDHPLPGFCNILEDLTLMLCVPLHGLDEVGDEVKSLLQLHVDLGPRLLDPVREDPDAVVVVDEDEDQHDDDRDTADHKPCNHALTIT